MLKKLLCVLLAASAATLWSQAAWTDFPETQLVAAPIGPRYIVPAHYRTVALQLSALQPVLAAAPERFTAAAADADVQLELPMPDGRMARFRLTESPVMAPGLQAKFPEIRCYTGVGIDDPGAFLKCDLTPQGFHAMISSPTQGTVFIDPYSQGDTEHYIVYFKKDFQTDKDFECGVENGPVHRDDKVSGAAPDMQGDCTFRRYRLALACTGEYATFHGGTQVLVLAAMNTSINRVNQIYERDLAITLQIIANNNLLIFLNSATDGYTNNNGFTMLTENQTKVANLIGSGNYDIGHVFSTGGGGVAGLGVVCGNSVKARGVTGSSQPVGDPFDIDYVAHEMGHQFGGNHTFNSSCGGNVNQGTAIEPGSGTTIMAYAGVCSPYNVQAHSDVHFHGISLQEIGTYVTQSQGNVCAVTLNSNNTAPVVSPGADYVIPRSTPFALTATATDVNGDSLTYCWEQIDNQSATMPPVATSTGGPMFRSFEPAPSPTRYFPRLQDIINNANPTWEKLPSVARAMNFRVSVRDNHSPAGCTDEDDIQLTVAANAGPFLVTVPNTNVTWLVGDQATVSWDVSNTDMAPVNCTQVRISLSVDGGFTYPVVLADAVPNTGSASVEVPNMPSATCRVKVEAVGNVFFDISNQNFKIELPPAPTFTVSLSNQAAQICSGDTVATAIYVTGIAGFTAPVDISVSGAPATANATILSSPAAPGDTVYVTLTDLVEPGVYNIELTCTSGAITRTRNLDLTIFNSTLTAPTPATPTDGDLGLSLSPTLSWNAVPEALNYQVQVSSSFNFAAGTIVYEQEVTTPTATAQGLDTATVYYWRVQARNICGQSAYGPVSSFQTGRVECGFTYNSTNVPVLISDNAVATVVSTLNVPTDRFVADVNLSVQADHTWVGDLVARVYEPSGRSALLFDQPGFPNTASGCGGNNLNLTFDDEAVQTAAALENACGNNPALSGTYRPIELLSGLDNVNAQGQWTLEMTDNFPEDGGSINAWSIRLCFYDSVPATALLVNNPLVVLTGAPGTIGTGHLIVNVASGNPTQGVFTLLSLPQHGTLALNGLPLGIGDTFTQDDIIAGTLEYTHSGDASGSDDFLFDVVDESTNGWVHAATFQILILQNDLAVTAQVTQTVSCAGGSDGGISIDVTGGTAPYRYSLNGGAMQFVNIFENLAAGSYTVMVTDQNNFTAESNVIILDDPAAIDVSVTVSNDDLNVSATGGSGALSYSIDGMNFQPANVFENLVNGTYTVTVRDTKGCTATAGGTVDVPALSVLADVSVEIACFGDAGGAISVSVTGGVMPYAYSLNGVDYQPGPVFTGLAAGTYTVTVRDDSGNTASAGSLTLTDPPALTLTATVDGDDITADAAGGTGALTYSIDGQNFQPENLFANQPNGFYTVTVKDANGCSATTEVVIAVDQLVIDAKITAQNACHGDSSAVITVTAAGGVLPYQYSLDGSNFQAGNVFTGLKAGTYTVTVMDDSGNSTTSTGLNITDPPAVSVMAEVSLNSIAVSAVGGTGTLTYSIDAENFQVDNHFNGLANGTYTITVRDGKGCTGTATAVIDVPPLLVEVTSTAILCFGATSTLIISPTGGIMPYQYSLDGGDFQNENTFENVGAGTHTLVVRDAAGIDVELNLNISGPDQLTATSSVQVNDALVTTQGGTAPYTYSLNGDPAQDENIFLDLPTGSYAVLVTDANGCTTIASFEVTYVPMSYQVTTTDVSCAGGSDGLATIVILGGVLPYTFSGGPVGGLPAGDYTLTVTDAVGEMILISFTISEPPLLNVLAEVYGDTIAGTATGGTPPYQYSVEGLNYQDSPIFPDLPNGTYNLWVKDANGCIAQKHNIVIDVIGTVSPEQQWGAQVRPNPGPGLFYLTLHTAPAGSLQATVFDAAGRRLREQVYEPLNGYLAAELDLGGLPAGVYWLRLVSGTQVGQLRLVIR